MLQNHSFFFDQYSVLGVKSLNYLDWRKIANMMKLGEDKTPSGGVGIRRNQENRVRNEQR